MTDELFLKLGVAAVMITYAVSTAWRLTKIYCSRDSDDPVRPLFGVLVVSLMMFLFAYIRSSVISPLFWAHYEDKFYALRQDARQSKITQEVASQTWLDTYSQMMDTASGNSWIDQDYIQLLYDQQFGN